MKATKKDIIAVLEARRDRSAWNRAVTADAIDLIDGLDGDEIAAESFADFEKLLLNCAEDWSSYSRGGSALIWNSDIAERYCTPSELKRTRGGERKPNNGEDWLDVQARALRQAARRAYKAFRKVA